MSSEILTTSVVDGVAMLRIDDGRVNVLSLELMAAIHEALDTAEASASAVVIVGREGKFCAGFNLDEVQESTASAHDVMTKGAELFLRLYGLSIPTVVACTGHALAAGAIMLLASDVRIGPDAPAKIGLNEISIGISLPMFVTELATDRLSKRHLTSATQLATLYSPAEAVDVGFLDRVVPADQVEAAAVEVAQGAVNLDRTAFIHTRNLLRGDVIRQIRGTLAADIAAMILPEQL